MNLLTEARKALGVLAVMEGAAVGYGILDSQLAGYITAGIGVALAGVTFLLPNDAGVADEPAGLAAVDHTAPAPSDPTDGVTAVAPTA